VYGDVAPCSNSPSFWARSLCRAKADGRKSI